MIELGKPESRAFLEVGRFVVVAVVAIAVGGAAAAAASAAALVVARRREDEELGFPLSSEMSKTTNDELR